MKLLIKNIVFRIFCILIFTFIYWYYSRDHFINSNKITPHFIDCVFLSTTVEAGVGYSSVYPVTTFGKIIMIIQQILMITNNLVTLYIFTI